MRRQLHMSYGAGGSLFPFADNGGNILVLFVDIVNTCLNQPGRTHFMKKQKNALAGIQAAAHEVLLGLND